MKKDKVVIKLKSITYLGDSIGDDISVEIKILDKIFTFTPPIKLKENLVLNSEILRFDLVADKFEENISIKITEKDFLFDDIGKIDQKINVDFSKEQSNEFSFEVKVQELGTNFRKVTALFQIVLVIETASFEQKEIIISKIREQAKLHNIDPNLAVTLAFCESKFDPLAISPTGAIGIFQLTRITRDQLTENLNFVITKNESFEVDKNIAGGIIYLSWIWKKYKGKQDEYQKLIAAWNAGPSVIPANGPITFNKITKPEKRVEAKQLVACVITNWKK